MQLADPLVAAWKAQLSLAFQRNGPRTLLGRREAQGPLVVQKPLYPEGDVVCHAIVVHPPGGIAGGDQLALRAAVGGQAHALLTTPGAGKWYRSAGPWAEQAVEFDVQGTLEWLPRETIVFDGALSRLVTRVDLGEGARYIGWEIVCLGRSGSGERFTRGRVELDTLVSRRKKIVFMEKGAIDGGGRLMSSPAGLGGHSVFGTFIATGEGLLAEARALQSERMAMTRLPGLLIARYLGDSSAEALDGFSSLWKAVRPGVCGREAVAPRIWAT